MRRSATLAIAVSAFAASLVLCACQREASGPEMTRDSERADTSAEPAASTPAPSQLPASPSNALMLATAGADHPYLADPTGRALYYLEGDKDGSRCTGACTEAWPPYLIDTEAAIPSASGNLQAALVATVRRADGTTQVTYNRHPLYRYAADAGIGRTAGHGVKDQWGQWHLLAADGSPVPPASEAAQRPQAPPGRAPSG